MKLLSRRSITVILVSAIVLSFTFQSSYACGPFSRYAVFSYSKHPDLPFEKYSLGDLGVLRSSYARSYLYVAYRLMSSRSFAKQEQEALSKLWNERLDFNSANKDDDATPGWIAARAKVAGIGPEPKLDVFRAIGKDRYDSFLNCHSDAFKIAGKTLEERIAKFGNSSPAVKEWTQAQDQVFSNCGGGATIPDQTTSSEPIVKADRAYQIAAAHFYATNFDDAQSHFEKIAADQSSQWREHALYLVARSLIRKASLAPVPDISQIQAVMDENGYVTETRTFKDNKYITKVVRTTRDALDRSAAVFNSNGESRKLPKDRTEDAMSLSGDALAVEVGWSVDEPTTPTSTSKEDDDRSKSLVEAEKVLRKMQTDIKNAALRQSAQGLLNLVDMRLHPELRLSELAQLLISKNGNDNLKQDLLDYTVLLDRYIGDSDQPHDANLKKAVDASAKDDLTEWLLEFQSEDKDSLGRSIEKWEKTNSLPWLIASLSKTDALNSKTPALLAAAERVEPTSPAFVTSQFHVIRLLIEKGDSTAARTKLDSLLQSEVKLPPSAANQLRHQRMIVAGDLNEFLTFALRQPAAFSWDDDGRETPIDVKADDDLKPWAGRSLFDVDATKLLNERFPVSMLREAATNTSLPVHVRRQIALAAWTRSALLDDVDTAKALVPMTTALAPELKTFLSAYLKATTKAARQTEALYTILKFPGLRPYLDASTGRLTPIGERDIYRDNWWCDMRPEPATSDESKHHYAGTFQDGTPSAKATLAFLSDEQVATAQREHARLLSLGSAPNHVAREAIEWANRDPKDSRIPEALHLAVTSTRYGCTDKESPKWSKAAFDLLHKRYPQSIWAKKTPYWFKNV